MYSSPLRRRPTLFVRPYLLAMIAVVGLMAAALLQPSGSLIPTSQALSSTVVISQIYGGAGCGTAGCSTFKNDYIELFNRGTSPVSLNGWSVQYAGATGTGAWTPTALTNVTLQPGQYYLVAEGAGANGVNTIPTADATGSIAMSATAGKVALVNSTTALSGGCPTSASIVDLIGYGSTANCSETAPAPAPSTTTADVRGAAGCTETDNNSADFTATTPNPRNTSTTLNPCSGGGGGDAAPTVSSTTPASNATNVAVDANVAINFSEPVNVTTNSFSISCASSGAHTFALTGSSAAYTLNPDTNFSNNETCTVTVIANQVTDVDTIDPPDNMAANYVFSFTTVASAGVCGDPFTSIPVIQGSGTASPLVGQSVTTEGVVTGDFQGTPGLNGFYLQDPNGDGNTATSDGIFVSSNLAVSTGDRVRVTGTAAENFNETGINNVTQLSICSTGNVAPPAVVIADLPAAKAAGLEQYEGMRVSFSQALIVTDNAGLGKFGELTVSANSRLYIPTNSVDPNDNPASGTNTTGTSNVPAVTAQQTANNNNRLIIDDANSQTNNSGLNPIPYLPAGGTIRDGDTVTNLTGVLGFGFSNYRLQPTSAPTFTSTNPRTAAPDTVGTSNLRVGFYNVANYFLPPYANNSSDRGANNDAEHIRQRDKIVAALVALNADVVGLSELQKAGGNAAAADIASALSTQGIGTYASVADLTTLVGTDADIKSGIIYRTSAVTTVGSPQTDTVAAAGTYSRDPIAQTFSLNSNGEQFTIVVNHLRSKGCSTGSAPEDADQGDGQACFNGRRRNQAQNTVAYINRLATTDPDVIAVGDFNSYAQEDPIDVFRAAGFTEETERFVAQPSRYSFLFSGEAGQLDFAFATPALNQKVTGATIWHIDADEPEIIGYDTDDTADGQRKPDDRYQPTPYHASDHDPLLIGINLSAAVQPGQVNISEFRFRGPGGSPTLTANNEFIEFYNTTASPLVVSTADGSAGWAVAAADGNTRFIIPNGTSIPARGHFLAVNSNGYSLSAYASGDALLLPDGVTQAGGYTVDIPDGSGIALFNTANPANFTLGNRLDAAGYAGNPSLYFEGTGFPTGGAEMTQGIEYSFVRDLRSSFAKDTGNNVADFLGVQTYVSGTGGATGQGAYLGAPGPENLSSPITRLTSQIVPGLINGSVSSSTSPNRVRNTDTYIDTLTPSGPTGTSSNYTLGTLSVQKRFTNNTGANVGRLRFRIVDVTTFGTPYIITSGTQADIRVLSSNGTVKSTGGATVITVRGLTLEQPPAQDHGGGWNASVSLDLSGLPGGVLTPGQSIDVQFLLGVAGSGSFRFFIVSEASN